MFASRITDTVKVGEFTVTIAKLSWSKLREASDKNTEHAMAVASRVGSDLIKTFREMDKDRDDKPRAESPDDRYKGYDKTKVLNCGVKAWTAPEKVTPEAIDDLEPDAAEKIFRAIIDLSIPPKEVAEAQRGESSGASTGS
jgi:hypothetical protein